MINKELLSKLLTSNKKLNNKMLEIDNLIDKEIFNTFSLLNFIHFEHSDLERLDKIKKDINNSNVFEDEMDNKKIWLKNNKDIFLGENILEFKNLEQLYTNSTEIYVVDNNGEKIYLNENEVKDLYLLENEYENIVSSLVKYIVFPHSNNKYSNVDFIISNNNPNNLIVDEMLKYQTTIDNVRVNRKLKFISEFEEIIDKYKKRVEEEIEEYKETFNIAKSFNLKMIGESIDEEYSNVLEELDKLKITYKTNKLENYIEKIEELKQKFKKIMEE